MNRISRLICLTSMLCLGASTAVAKSIILSGEMNIVKPKLRDFNTDNRQAFVSEFSLAAIASDDTGCDITGDIAYAMADHGENLVCLLEWTDLPSGLSASGLNVAGFLADVGQVELSYQISTFSGSARTKVTLEEDKVSLNSMIPTLPTLISGVTHTSTDASYNTMDFTSYDRESLLQRIVVTVESRPYVQVVKLLKEDGNYESCVVDVDDTACEMRLDWIDDVNTEIDQSAVTFPLVIDSENGYFSSTGVAVEHDWIARRDFRPPSSEGFIAQALSPENGQSQSHDIGGVQFTVQNNQGKLVVSSPHQGKSGNWWQPTAKIKLKPMAIEDKVIPEIKNISGYNLIKFTAEDLIQESQVEYDLVQSGAPKVLDGRLIYTFDLSGIEDGRFIPEIHLADKYDNSAIVDDDLIMIDRAAPEIRVFYDDDEYQNNDNIFMLEKMDIVGIDTLDGSAVIESAFIDSRPLILSGDTSYVKAVGGSHLELVPDQIYPLDITVSDKAGNRRTDNFNVRYMPVQYHVENSDKLHYNTIQNLSYSVFEASGDKCKFVDSDKELTSNDFGFNPKPLCQLEWIKVPEGLSPTFNYGINSITGYADKGLTGDDLNAEFKVWMVDENNTRALAAHQTVPLSIVQAEDPKISANQYNMIEPGLFAVALNGSSFTRLTAEGVNADLTVSVKEANESTVTSLKRQSKRYTKVSKMSHSLRSKRAQLWERNTYEYNTEYQLDPTLTADGVVETIAVPNSGLRLKAKVDDKDTFDNEIERVVVNLGKYNSDTRTYDYDHESMGSWTTYLAESSYDKALRKYVYNPITPKKLFEQGVETLPFDIDISQLEYGRYRFMGVAELNSPIASYTRSMKTTSMYYNVLKSGEILGDISLTKISNPVPFTVAATFRTKTRPDKEALGEIQWQMRSAEQDTWVNIGNRTSLRTKLEQPGHYFIRVITTNKRTAVKYTTDVYEILAYERPDLDIVGPSSLLKGDTASYSLLDHDMPADIAIGDIEWSLDKETWVSGSETFDVEGEGKQINLWVRMSYLDNELAGDKRFDIELKRIYVRKPERVRLNVKRPTKVEMGVPFDLTGSYKLSDSKLDVVVKRQWKLPNGNVVDDQDILNYTPTEEDAENKQIAFTYIAWVEGYEKETYKESTVSIKVVKYEFPEHQLKLTMSHHYAPMKGRISIQRLTRIDVPMKFTYTVKPLVNLELIDHDDTKSLINIQVEKPGVYPVEVVVRDERGNEQRLVEFLDIEDAPAPTFKFYASYSNKNMREPLNVSLRSTVKLGHPNDRVKTRIWSVNGEVVEGGNYSLLTTGLMEGTHVLSERIISNYGVEATEDFVVEVVDNLKPICDVTHNILRDDLVNLMASCRDPDGRIVGYRWDINGEETLGRGEMQSYRVTPEDSSITVKVVGIDDSGEMGEFERVISVK